jgi:formate dehydrogenase major subunit
MSGVRFTLDGREVEARAGETILTAARRHGVRIPHLCYTDGMRVDGNCRACVVEIEGERVLQPSCYRTPAEGMVVRTASERARHSQRMVLELLQSDMPAEQYRADSELALWTEELGVRAARFPSRRQPSPDLSHAGMTVRLDACIQCTRCVRACREVQVNDVIGYAARGADAHIVFDFDDPMGQSTCVACGECVQACPTGALMPRSIDHDHAVLFPRAARELAAEAAGTGTTAAGVRSSYAPVIPGAAGNGVATGMPAGNGATQRSVPSLCPYCGVGCQVLYHVSGGQEAGADHPHHRPPGSGEPGASVREGPFRLRLRAQPAAADEAADPPGGGAQAGGRAGGPPDWGATFREASWEEALDVAADGLRRVATSAAATPLAGFGSAKGSNEEAYLFQKLIRTGFGTNNVDHCTRLCHASSRGGAAGDDRLAARCRTRSPTSSTRTSSSSSAPTRR